MEYGEHRTLSILSHDTDQSDAIIQDELIDCGSAITEILKQRVIHQSQDFDRRDLYPQPLAPAYVEQRVDRGGLPHIPLSDVYEKLIRRERLGHSDSYSSEPPPGFRSWGQGHFVSWKSREKAIIIIGFLINLVHGYAMHD